MRRRKKEPFIIPLRGPLSDRKHLTGPAPKNFALTWAMYSLLIAHLRIHGPIGKKK